MRRTITRLAGTLAIATLGVGAFAGISAATSAPTSSTTFYACVDHEGHLENITTGTPRCDHWASVVSWNSTGPQGPAGNTGPQGPAGPPGPAGPSAASGTGYVSGTGVIPNIGPGSTYVGVSSYSDGSGGCYLYLNNSTATDVTGFVQVNNTPSTIDITSGSSYNPQVSSATHFEFQVATSFGNLSLDYWLSPTSATSCTSAWRYLVS